MTVGWSRTSPHKFEMDSFSSKCRGITKIKGRPETADKTDSAMNCSSDRFVTNEIRETEAATPCARILSFEGRDLRDSLPWTPSEADEQGRYDLICVDNLVEKIRAGKARELLAELFSGLNPGGRLLVGSPPPSDEEDLASLSAMLPDREIAGQVVFRDPADGTAFLEVYRRAA